MTKYFNTPITFEGRTFKFNHFLGVLTSRRVVTEKKTFKSREVDISGDKQLCIAAVTNPFLLHQYDKSDNWKQIKNREKACRWAKLITWLCTHCYPLAYLCTHIRLNLFDNARDASQFYYHVYPSFKQQRVLCLPRAIFIATTSKRFKEHGVMFVGSFLPTVRMHAWVVEDGNNANIYDNEWICFQPVMMMT